MEVVVLDIRKACGNATGSMSSRGVTEALALEAAYLVLESDRPTLRVRT